MSSFTRIHVLLVLLSFTFLISDTLGATRTVAVTINGAGEVNRNPALDTYPNGATVTLTATPSNGWMFTAWGGDAAGGANPLNLLLDADKSVVATFALIPGYSLTVTVSGAGSVEPSGGDFASNTVVNVSATPSNGWVFARWSGGQESTANPLALTMNGPQALTATFAELPRIVRQPQSVSANAGDGAEFEVEAAGAAPLRYQWSLDGILVTGATNRVLSIPNVQPSRAGGYSVRVFNDYGSVTSVVASLTVLDSCVGSNLVTACNEAGLRAAMSLGGVVRFCCNGTITLSNTIDVATDVILDASKHDVVISGNSAVRLFSVRSNVSLSMTNVLLANGRHQGANGTAVQTVSGWNVTPAEDGVGGAILNNGGTVNLVTCILSNNAASGGNGTNGFNGVVIGGGEVVSPAGSGRGGAIFNFGGIVRLHSVVAVSNSVVGGFGAPTASATNGHGQGGSLASVGGEVVVADSRFLGNSAIGRKGKAGNFSAGPEAGGAMGGAAYLADVTFNAEGSEFSGNIAVGEATSQGDRPASADGGAFHVASGHVRLTRTVLSSNTARGSQGFRHSGTGTARGGAVFNYGRLYLRDVTMSQNESLAGDYSSLNGNGNGGAIFNAASGVLENVTVTRNKARGGTAASFGSPGAAFSGADGSGGGIFNTGTLAATNCTLALNIAEAGSASGLSFVTNGGMASGGAIFNQGGTLGLMNVTVASNLVVQGQRSPASRGANVANDTNGTVVLRNSIVAGGQGAPDSWGIIIDGGFNMASDGSCMFASGTSFNFTDPKLGPLMFYGGLTETMELLPDSPAIDFGSAAGAPAMDQRGRPRPFGAGFDMGAFEAGPVTPRLVAKANVLYFEGKAGVTYDLWRSADMKSWELDSTIQPPISVLVGWPAFGSRRDTVYFRLSVR